MSKQKKALFYFLFKKLYVGLVESDADSLIGDTLLPGPWLSNL